METADEAAGSVGSYAMMGLLMVLATVVGMEVVAWGVHRYIMHGKLGWGWHESHHTHTPGKLERNDLYAVVFSLVSGALFVIGLTAWEPAWFIGVGMAVYGLLYYFVHDGLVHQRWPFRYTPKGGYLHRLVLAHRMHHHTTGRQGGVSFGFLWAEKPEKLKARLKAQAVTAQAGRS